jgi:hypothetical protein
MNTYIITEKQNAQSRRAGSKIEARSLSDAKRAASREQMFKGTTLTIESNAGELLAVKEDGRWVNKVQL